MVLVICYLTVVVPWAGVHPWGSLGKRPLAPTPPIFNDGATKIDPGEDPFTRMVPFFERRHAPEAASSPAIRLPRQFGARYNSRLIMNGAPQNAPGAPRNALPMTTAAIRRLAIPSADELVERA